jgi:hypothetical protein
MKSDYQKALDRIKIIPKIYLGQEVDTPIGRGIVVSIQMAYNGLYLSPEKSTAIVWFSTSEAKGGFVNKQFSLSELKTPQIIRKEKLQKLNSQWNKT